MAACDADHDCRLEKGIDSQRLYLEIVMRVVALLVVCLNSKCACRVPVSPLQKKYIFIRTLPIGLETSINNGRETSTVTSLC